MTIVEKVINFIQSKVLKQFKSDLEAEYGDAVHYAEERCLIREKLLESQIPLKSEVQKGKIYSRVQ